MLAIMRDQRERIVWPVQSVNPELRVGLASGEVLDVVETAGLPCFACMLGGPEGKHLFMLVAPSSDAGEAAKAPLGKVLVTEVSVSRAGLP